MKIEIFKRDCSFQARLKMSSKIVLFKIGPLRLQLHSQMMKHARLVSTIFAEVSAKTFPNRDSSQNCSAKIPAERLNEGGYLGLAAPGNRYCQGQHFRCNVPKHFRCKVHKSLGNSSILGARCTKPLEFVAF